MCVKNSIYALERLAVVASQEGDLKQAALLWQRIETLLRHDVQWCVDTLDNYDTEVVWILQHETEDVDTKLFAVAKARAEVVNSLAKRAEWLARALAKTWCNKEEIVKAAQTSNVQ